MKENSIENLQNKKYFRNIDEAIKVYEKFRRFKDKGFIKSIDPDFFFNLTDMFLSDYKRVLKMNEVLLKENENLESENSRLKVIRYSREYGTENIYLITKSDLVQIDINKYMIEIEDGKFVDLKQIYQENEKYKRLAEMNLKSAEEFKNNICEHRCLLKSENKEQKECTFREDGTEECLWHCSNCHDEWLFYEGTPEENNLKYCPHCGAKVIKYESYIETEIEIANKMVKDYLKESEE